MDDIELPGHYDINLHDPNEENISQDQSLDI